MLGNQLLTFISVAKNGSFSKAAESAFVSPAAVMKQIDSLEKRLGVTRLEKRSSAAENNPVVGRNDGSLRHNVFGGAVEKR